MDKTLYFEDLQKGQQYATARHTVTGDEIRHFADLSGDHNLIHEDREAAVEAGFADTIAHGMLVLSLATGLRSETGFFARSVIAFLGIEGWKFGAPVVTGDQILCRWTIVEVRPSRSRTDRGVVRQQVEIVNQKGVVVQQGVFVTMMRKRPADTT